MTEYTHYISGSWVPTSQASIPAFDLSILRGFGIFDYLRTYGRAPFTLSLHIDRLFRSAQYVGISLTHTKAELIALVKEGIEKNDTGTELDIRIVVTGGVGPNSTTPGTPNVLILFGEVSSYPQQMYDTGVSIISSKMIRQIPKAKTINYMMAIPALMEAKKRGALEVIYVGDDHHVYEGTTSNIFSIKNNIIVTPEENILEGITRLLVCDIAQDLQIPLKKTSLLYSDLLASDEVFITASNKEIMPVVHIDAHVIGDGKVGTVTKRLRDAYEKLKTDPRYLR